jgi:hypothetical protein
MHVDPEFNSFTYGDPTRPKRSLARLKKHDLLVFYAGLEGYDLPSPPALYIIGFFEVEIAGLATTFSQSELETTFRENFHVRHSALFEVQKAYLLLIKGTSKSRLLSKAQLISSTIANPNGPPLKVLSSEMRSIFGDLNGKPCIQRSPPRWIDQTHVEKASNYVWSLT